MYKSLNGKDHSPLEHKPIVVFFKSHKKTLHVTASYMYENDNLWTNEVYHVPFYNSTQYNHYFFTKKAKYFRCTFTYQMNKGIFLEIL